MNLHKDIKNIIDNSGFDLLNGDKTKRNGKKEISSGNIVNTYKIDFGSILSDTSGSVLNEELIVETSIMTPPSPPEIMKVSSLIHDFLKSQNADSTIKEYGLAPFEMPVQPLRRTFADKVFAIADYFGEGKSFRLSRHIYDLHKMSSSVTLDDDFAAFVEGVRQDRKQWRTRCKSAQDGYDIQEALQKIIDTEHFRQDYEQITQGMLYENENISYEKAIAVVSDIIESGTFAQCGRENTQELINDDFHTMDSIYDRVVGKALSDEPSCIGGIDIASILANVMAESETPSVPSVMTATSPVLPEPSTGISEASSKLFSATETPNYMARFNSSDDLYIAPLPTQKECDNDLEIH
jgi:hypothetical protein